MSEGNHIVDLSNAALLIAAVYGLTELVKAFLPASLSENSKVKAGLAVVVSFVAVFLVGATAWASEQVIGDVHLDKMSVADKVLVSIFVAGAAALVQRGLKAVTNIGENQPEEKKAA